MFWLKPALKFFMRLSKSLWSSFLTDVNATQDAVFLCTSCPNLDLPFATQ